MKKRKLLAVTLLSTILLNSAVPLVVADTSFSVITHHPLISLLQQILIRMTRVKQQKNKSKETASQHDTQKDHKSSHTHPTPSFK